MAQSADHFESFEPHTLLKHAIYRAYVERWARILGSWNDRLRIVDACAGTGADESGQPGSPLIAVVEADRAAEQLTRERGVQKTVEVLAIEKDSRHFAELRKRLAEYAPRHRACQGTLADHIEELERDFNQVPTLFFIDPFGLEPLRADVVRRALQGPKNEVFLLFADQAALRHVGVVDAVAERVSDTPFIDMFDEAPATAPAVSEHTHKTSQGSIKILDAVFGGDAWRSIVELPSQRRRQAFVDLYRDLLESFGAKRVLPLPILAGNVTKYHLIYATRSKRGYEVMKDAVDRALNQGIVFPRTAELMRLGTQVNEARLKEIVLEEFAGREVAWKSDDRKMPSIRTFMLEDTPAMPSQMNGLRRSLSSYRISGTKAYRYRFPPRDPR